jgi:hypothetical protein
MKIIGISCVIVLASFSTVIAQNTSPAPVDLAYHFKAGTVLHYQRLDESRKPGSPPGRAGGNYDIKEDIVITVEKVDLDGSAMLIVQNEEADDLKGADKNQVVKIGRVSATYSQDIPMYRVKVDKYGRYLDGAILKRTPEDSIQHEKLKDPNVISWGGGDSERIQWSLYKNLFPRSPRTAVRLGTSWNDSVFKPEHPHRFPVNHAASGPVIVDPPGPSYTSQRYDYSLTQNTKDRKSGIFELNTQTIYYTVFGGESAGQAKVNMVEQFRSLDGLPILRTESGKGLDNSDNKTTFKLISIDSTAH